MKTIYLKNVLVAFILSLSFSSFSQIINTVAGNGYLSGSWGGGGYSGDGGQATAAELWGPNGLTLDVSMNIYVADLTNQRIRKINTSGIISTVAGNGYAGFSGDGGPATNAEIYNPAAVIVDTAGNLYISDLYNSRVRKVDVSGIITTIVGNGISGFSGDGGPATAAEINAFGLALDASGNIYIADCGNQCIRKVAKSGIISTVAGNTVNGFSGDGGQATAAELYCPIGVALDASGNIYIADECNDRIRKVNTSGIITTIAGGGSTGLGDGGLAINAELYYPYGVALDGLGNVYIADLDNERIREVNTSGIITTVAGNGYGAPSSGRFSGDGGQATSAELWGPHGVALDVANNLYISDAGNDRIRKVTSITGINNLSFYSNEVIIYPSPTPGNFTVSGIIKGQIIEIYNYLGEKIRSTVASNSIMHFDISNKANGIYFLRILDKDDSVVITKKVLKTE